MAMSDYARSLNAHYGRPDLLGAILDGLRAAGKDAEAPTREDLAPVDQFHIGGLPATRELAELAGIRAGMEVLDVGGGIGGPARALAAEYGCDVTVLDITEEFCRAGEGLTTRLGLSERVRFRCASALEMPFPDQSFDVVWTQHSSMNIEDKRQLYAEAYRVLRPGGRLALHEVMAGPTQPVYFPAPWAEDPSVSFLLPPAEMRTLIAGVGFREAAWRDVTEQARTFFEAMRPAIERAAGGDPPPLGVHLLRRSGTQWGASSLNQIRNLAEERIALVEAVFEHP